MGCELPSVEEEGWPRHQEEAGRVGSPGLPLLEPDVQISRIRLSCKQSTSTARHRQVLQTKLAQMRVEAQTLRRTVTALAAASQMDSKALLRVIIEMAVGSARIADSEVGGPPL